MTTYAFDGFSVLRDDSGDISEMTASSYVVVAKNNKASLTQSDIGGVSSNKLLAAGITGESALWAGEKVTSNVLEMMSGTMMGTNVLYDIPEFPGWAVDLMADKMNTSPIMGKVAAVPSDVLGMMSGMLTGTNVLFDIPDLPGADGMMSGALTGTNILFDIPDLTGEGPGGSWVGIITGSNIVFSVPNAPENGNEQQAAIISGSFQFGIPGLPGADGMMSGMLTGTDILFDFPESPSDGVWQGSIDFTGLEFRFPTANGMMSGTVTGTNVLFDIPDVPGVNSFQPDMLTGTGNWRYVPVRRAVEDNQAAPEEDTDHYSLLQRIEAHPGLTDDLLNAANATLLDVSWNSLSGEKSAIVLKLTDPDTGAEHFFGLKGDALPGFDGSFDRAQSWLDLAVFTTPTSEDAAEGWILFFDEADSVFKTQADNLMGTAAGDKINSGKGNDVIFSLQGDDRIKAGKGNDAVNSGAGDDVVKGGAGRDVLVGGDGLDHLLGQKGADIIDGGEGRDTLEGGKGNDVLTGGIGKDYLKGGAGKDMLIGGLYSDTLEGGKGADMFIFDAQMDNGYDGIRDFEIGVDKIHIVNALTVFDIEMRQHGRLVIVEFADTTISLTNTDVDDLSMDDFVFTLAEPDQLA